MRHTCLIIAGNRNANNEFDVCTCLITAGNRHLTILMCTCLITAGNRDATDERHRPVRCYTCICGIWRCLGFRIAGYHDYLFPEKAAPGEILPHRREDHCRCINHHFDDGWICGMSIIMYTSCWRRMFISRRIQFCLV